MKYYLLSFFLLVSIFSFSQNKNLSIGLQSNFPTKGLSLKLDIDSTNQIQLSYSLYKDFFSNRNLYGWKYSRTINKFKYFQSYTYVGFMIMSYSLLGVPINNYGNEKNGTTFSYGLGVGIQNTLFHRLNLSLEGGYGKYNFNSSNEDFGFVGGFGLHYYFRRKE
jgi:hypothetical protein